MNTKNNKPEIFEYDNYREFLKDMYAHLKTTKPQFSYRYFSRVAGFKSPNFLKLVIDGERNLSSDSLQKFVKALKLDAKEGPFFRHLVLLGQATTLEEKKYFAEELIKSKFYKKLHPLKKVQYAYYANWYMIPIREMVGLKNFKEDPKWIAKQLKPNITTKEAEVALEQLEKLGLICREANGTLIKADEFVTTEEEVDSISVVSFLKSMANLGIQSIYDLDEKERDVSAATITLSKENFVQVKTLIQNFRKELLAISKQNTGANNNVYQVNFHLFPLTNIQGDTDDNTS